MEIRSRLFHSPSASFLLFGPRGIGKTTFLQEKFPNALWVDLLQPEVYRALLAKPERLAELIEGNPEKTTIVIDEIQKVPAVLDVVHQLIEKKIGLHFILTGSSARKLRRGAANLLAGRLLSVSMHPFMAAELGEEFDLEFALEYGLIPLIVQSTDAQARLNAYLTLYLKEEVQAEGMVRNAGNFSRFLECISFSHGSVLNISEVARECELGRKTVEGYLEILEDLLLAFRVPVFSKRAKRILIKHQKFYYFDTGVYRSVRPKGPLDLTEEIEGVALEGLVAQHLRAWCAYHSGVNQLYYWRTKSGNEVDFVVYGEEVFIALEVKRSARVNNKDLSSLKSFKEDYPEAEVGLLYLGKEKLNINGISCIPCGEFLLNILPGKRISLVTPFMDS